MSADAVDAIHPHIVGQQHRSVGARHLYSVVFD